MVCDLTWHKLYLHHFPLMRFSGDCVTYGNCLEKFIVEKTIVI